MRLIRNVLVAGVLAAAAVGCQVKKADAPVALNDTPLVIDGAMQARDWDQSKALYENGRVPANTDRFILQTSDKAADNNWSWATDTPIFLANSVIFPFTYFGDPPGQWVEHPSVTTPTTYNASPKTEVIPPYGLPH